MQAKAQVNVFGVEGDFRKGPDVKIVDFKFVGSFQVKRIGQLRISIFEGEAGRDIKTEFIPRAISEHQAQGIVFVLVENTFKSEAKAKF